MLEVTFYAIFGHIQNYWVLTIEPVGEISRKEQEFFRSFLPGLVKKGKYTITLVDKPLMGGRNESVIAVDGGIVTAVWMSNTYWDVYEKHTISHENFTVSGSAEIPEADQRDRFTFQDADYVDADYVLVVTQWKEQMYDLKAVIG